MSQPDAAQLCAQRCTEMWCREDPCAVVTATTPPPPRDGEVCAALVAELDTFLGQWRTVGAIPFELSGIVDRFRPAAPSEPPAADSPTPGTDPYADCRAVCGSTAGCFPKPCLIDHPAAPSPVGTTEPPAETQQDDEVSAVGQAILHALLTTREQPNSGALALELARSALAARPTADTKGLRERIEALESSYRANGEQRDALGKPAWPLNVARDLRAALDAR